MASAGVEKRLFFTALPDLSVLTAFRAAFTSKQEIIGIQPPCCRELIFTLQDILVSPAFDNKSNLFIIVEKKLTSSAEFSKTLEHLHIKLCTRLEVDTELFEYCLTYTIYQKLAPFWNRTNSFLVSGRNFLQVKDKLSATGLELYVTDKICIALEPFQIRSPPIEVEDFSIDFKSLWNFKRDSSAKISGHSVEDSICYVLPSFRKCHITSITHSIPKNTPFKDYDALKQHWKLSYGYRLPGEDCQLYFNVRFNGSNVFTYPEWCVRKNDAVRYLRCDTDEICSLFFADLQQRMPSIFGKPFKFTNKSLFWQKMLPTADKGNKSFLTNQPQLNNVNKTKVFSSNNHKTISTKESTTPSGFQYEKTDTGNHHFNKQTIEPNSCKTSSANRSGDSLQQTASYKRNLSLSNSANKKKVNNELSKSSITSSSILKQNRGTPLPNKDAENQKPENIKDNRELINKSRITAAPTLKQLHQKQTKIITKNSPLLGGRNIIDVPDSPFDQLVPEELLQNNVNLNNENALLYSQTKLPNNQRNNNDDFDPVENKTDFSLIDETMFEDDGHESQVVPDETAKDSSNLNSVQAGHLLHSTNPTRDAKEHFQFDSDSRLIRNHTTELSRCTTGKTMLDDASRVVPLSNSSNSCSMIQNSMEKEDDIFPKGEKNICPIAVGEKRKDMISSYEIPSSQKVVPQFGRSSKKKKMIGTPNTTKQFTASQQLSTNCSTESNKVVPSFKKTTNHNKTTTGNAKPRNNFPEKRKQQQLSTSVKMTSETSIKKPKISAKAPVNAGKTTNKCIKNSMNSTTESKTPSSAIRNLPLPSTPTTSRPMVTSTNDLSIKKKSFSCVKKEHFMSSQGLSLANEILRNISSSQSAVKEMSASQGSTIIQQTPDSTTTNNSANKKPRAKPKINEDINVEEMAKNGKLSKVNAPTLKNWLKSKSVVFKSSEKKDVLVIKALEYLGISTTTTITAAVS